MTLKKTGEQPTPSHTTTTYPPVVKTADRQAPANTTPRNEPPTPLARQPPTAAPTTPGAGNPRHPQHLTRPIPHIRVRTHPTPPSSIAGIPRIAPAIPDAQEHKQRGHGPAGTTPKRDTHPQTRKKPTSQRQPAAHPTRLVSQTCTAPAQARPRTNSYWPIKRASTATTRASRIPARQNPAN